MEDKIKQFITEVRTNNIEIYNEFSLQHELGIFLRNQLSGFSIQFERNISFFNLPKNNFIKKEIDISIFTTDKSCCHTIELKYPRNGQHPEQMFSFCKDIVFLEQLVKERFKKSYLLIFADDKLFYSGNSNGIYKYFRNEVPLTGKIQKPTGSKNITLSITGKYTIKWNPIKNNLMYALIEVPPSSL